MGVADNSSGQTAPSEEWIDRYKIQSQKYSRLVTVPKAVEIEIEDTVWVWRCRNDDDDQRTEYLRLSKKRPADASTPPGETFVSTCSVMPHGERGKSVTIPNECDEECFAGESMVWITCGREENGEVSYLKLIPESNSAEIAGLLSS